MAGAFTTHGRAYFEAGLAVTPTTGFDGKRPILKGYHRKLLGPGTIDKLGVKYPDANLAIVTGLSKVVVIDVDDPSQRALDVALERFGPSPLIIRTGGRGGHHILYSGNQNLRPHDFRYSEDLLLELKADGNIVITPPSVNPQTGRNYEFVKGGLDDFARLPPINIATIPGLSSSVGFNSSKASVNKRQIEVGERNKWLFSQCLRHARACDDLDALIDVARTRAEEHFGERMSDVEIIKTASSAWGYEAHGKNWAAKAAHSTITMMELRRLEERGSDAVALTLHLRLEHGGRMSRGETFALDTRAMERDQTIAGWSRSRYRRAIGRLVAAGIIVVRHRGSGIGDPSLYCIEMPTERRGPPVAPM